jgi:hypothetical protein
VTFFLFSVVCIGWQWLLCPMHQILIASWLPQVMMKMVALPLHHQVPTDYGQLVVDSEAREQAEVG